jgi:polysaccharide export outer membrane protein
MLTACLMGTAVKAEGQGAAYQIQPGDVLQVSVWKETELQGEVLVRSDGGLSFPLVGDLHAAGSSIAQLADALGERIRKLIPDAIVTVALKVSNGNRIYVVGKVNRPGEYAFARPIDVMQAIALAAGTTPYANVGDIRILRRDGERQLALRFDYTDVERGKQLESNIVLRSGDTVVVP